MTLPRCIEPGDTHFISRRCTQRMFLLRPRSIVEQAFLYVCAIAAKDSNIQLHAVVVMSNHWHALVTDPDGKLPKFLNYVHMYVSKILNCDMGRFENLWSVEKPSVVTLKDDVDVTDKLAYLMANPVAAQLVEYGEQWPGLRRMWQHGAENVTVQRPTIFYRTEGKMPLEATLHFTRPPALRAMHDADASLELEKIVLRREAEERKHIQAAKGRYVGVSMILRQKLTATPNTYSKMFGLSPRIGAKNKWARIETLRRLKQWYRDYRAAYVSWREGNHDTRFPQGTYALRLYAGVRCVSSGG